MINFHLSHGRAVGKYSSEHYHVIFNRHGEINSGRFSLIRAIISLLPAGDLGMEALSKKKYWGPHSLSDFLILKIALFDAKLDYVTQDSFEVSPYALQRLRLSFAPP